MKRIISILFLISGIAFANSAFSQTSHPKKKSKKESGESASTQKGGGDASGGGSITVDEQGTPKVKTKSTNVENPTTTPASDTAVKDEKKPGVSNEKTDNDDDSPSPIAIDEGGLPKIKSKPTSAENPNSSTGLGSDSTTIAPASGVER